MLVSDHCLVVQRAADPAAPGTAAAGRTVRKAKSATEQEAPDAGATVSISGPLWLDASIGNALADSSYPYEQHGSASMRP